jgi:hypothetical protein
MPKIVESDESFDYESEQDEEAHQIEPETPHPRKAAAMIHIASRNSNKTPSTARPAPATTTTPATAASRRRIGEDDDDSPPQPISQSKKIIITNTSRAGSSIPAKPLASNRMETSDDEFSLSDEEGMQSPKAKRRKLVSPSKPTAKTTSNLSKASKQVKSAQRQYYSDDDEDFDEDDNVLSDSEDDQAIMFESSGEEDYVPKKTSKPQEDMIIDDEIAPPQAKKRGRPPGSKNRPKDKASNAKRSSTPKALKKAGRSRKVQVGDEDDDFLSDEDEAYGDEYDLDHSDEEDGESDSDNLMEIGLEGPKKMTARQKAIVGETQAEHVALAGTRLVQAPVEQAKQRRGPTLGAKTGTVGRPSHRTQPPEDVMQEVTTIVGQLMNRSALDKVEVKRNLRAEPMFNPELVKFWSREDGNFVTLPLAHYEAMFPPTAGWSSSPLRANDTKDIPVLTLKRGLMDSA